MHRSPAYLARRSAPFSMGYKDSSEEGPFAPVDQGGESRRERILELTY